MSTPLRRSPPSRRHALLGLATLIVAIGSCLPHQINHTALAATEGRQPSAPSAWPVTFTDIAAESGLVHPTIYGGVDRKRFIIETNGSGVALVDVDNDGWLDALVLSGTRLKDGARSETDFAAAEAPTNRLYRNLHNGRFEDVTDRAGLRRTGWASGVCAGDYDNDGFIDLFVTVLRIECPVSQRW